MKKTIDYNLKNIPIVLWKKIQHKTIDLRISIKQFIIEACQDKLKRK